MRVYQEFEVPRRLKPQLSRLFLFAGLKACSTRSRAEVRGSKSALSSFKRVLLLQFRHSRSHVGLKLFRLGHKGRVRGGPLSFQRH
jgi:hypothetical protein